MVDGTVTRVSADSSEPQAKKDGETLAAQPRAASTYKAIVRLQAQQLGLDGRTFPLTSGMQVLAEINQGQRTILGYLLSPVQGVFQEAMRER